MVVTMIIAAFGTSLTSQAGWLEPLQKELEISLGRQVIVADYARAGANSKWALANVGPVISVRPDVVLIEFSANDASWFKGVSLTRSRYNTERLVHQLRHALPKAEIFLMTMNPFGGFRKWARPRLETYYNLYRLVAKEIGVGCIDIRAAWRNINGSVIRAGIPDGAHPVPELASRVLVPIISEAIKARTAIVGLNGQ